MSLRLLNRCRITILILIVSDLLVFNSSLMAQINIEDSVRVNRSYNYDYSNSESKEIIDLKVYPVFRFKNTRLDVMYLLQLNLNPTLEIRPWRGAKATAQVIFPLINGYSVEEGKIRPGFITFSQQINLPFKFHALATIGNFNMFRGGFDLKAFQSLGNKFGLFGQLSYTAHSALFFDNWYYNDSFLLTWRVGVNYVYKPLKLIINASAGKYLGNDFSVRGEIIRYFRNSSVGFYIQTLNAPDSRINGGFFFAISLPPYNKTRAKFVNVGSGDYFSMEYIARPYSQYGRYFNTSPDENSSYNFFNKFHFNYLFDN